MRNTNDVIRELEKLRESEDRGSLASLRRGLGQPPGAVPETTKVVEHMLDDDDWSSTRDALYIVGPLYALHSQSETQARWSNIGSHFRSLIGDNAEPPPSVERRFMALLASEPDELADTLRQAITLLKAGNVPVNWRTLFEDVQQLLDSRQEGEKKRQDVRLRWSRSFWRLSKPNEGTDAVQPETETVYL